MLVGELALELSRAHQDVPVILDNGAELESVYHIERDCVGLVFGDPPKSEEEERHNE